MPGPRSHAGTVRIRRGRLCAALSAVLVTLVSVLGGIGVLPTDSAAPAAAATPTTDQQGAMLTGVTLPDGGLTLRGGIRRPDPEALPESSGAGRRVVYDIGAQRVWLVGARDKVLSTYLVSGSLTDNLDPGTYSVYSRSRWAIGIDDSGTMQYFVRFAHGQRAAIGFHSIPRKDGHLLQMGSDLGTPQSHGCIRQAMPDAKRLWDFAPLGTKVVVTA